MGGMPWGGIPGDCTGWCWMCCGAIRGLGNACETDVGVPGGGGPRGGPPLLICRGYTGDRGATSGEPGGPPDDGGGCGPRNDALGTNVVYECAPSADGCELGVPGNAVLVGAGDRGPDDGPSEVDGEEDAAPDPWKSFAISARLTEGLLADGDGVGAAEAAAAEDVEAGAAGVLVAGEAARPFGCAEAGFAGTEPKVFTPCDLRVGTEAGEEDIGAETSSMDPNVTEEPVSGSTRQLRHSKRQNRASENVLLSSTHMRSNGRHITVASCE